jgi:alkylation response protein AidB-like acyl-CoA dehydrogenase
MSEPKADSMHAWLGSRPLREFRQSVRDLCAQHLPSDIRQKVDLNIELEKSDYVRWQKILQRQGWFCGQWPLQYGGRGWSPAQRFIFEEETARAAAPWLTPFGIAYAGPVIYSFGSEEQKRQYLPAILTSDTWWCQGYSEPQAGSDLAGLATRAVRDGDHYVINGQKIWTTMAHWADMMFALVRTSTGGKAQEGISFMLIDMRSPGITVRPIVSIEERHHLNEVFFEDVRVPVGNLVGEEGGGWTYSKFLLNNERLLAAETGKSKRRLDKLRLLVGSIRDGGGVLGDRPLWQRRLAELQVRMLALESVCHGMLFAAQAPSSTADASILKILGSELGQAITSAQLAAAGHVGLMMGGEDSGQATGAGAIRDVDLSGIVRDHLHERASTIYGGTNEIQRNIIAKSMLGL